MSGTVPLTTVAAARCSTCTTSTVLLVVWNPSDYRPVRGTVYTGLHYLGGTVGWLSGQQGTGPRGGIAISTSNQYWGIGVLGKEIGVHPGTAIGIGGNDDSDGDGDGLRAHIAENSP
eukprot:COSAG02_NODE_2466_length_8783_cov_405.845463_3_plen_117_part_00